MTAAYSPKSAAGWRVTDIRYMPIDKIRANLKGDLDRLRQLERFAENAAQIAGILARLATSVATLAAAT